MSNTCLSTVCMHTCLYHACISQVVFGIPWPKERDYSIYLEIAYRGNCCRRPLVTRVGHFQAPAWGIAIRWTKCPWRVRFPIGFWVKLSCFKVALEINLHSAGTGNAVGIRQPCRKTVARALGLAIFFPIARQAAGRTPLGIRVTDTVGAFPADTIIPEALDRIL